MIQRIVRKALWGLFFCFFEKIVVPILTSGGYVGLSIAKAVSTYDGAEIFEEISEKGA